MTPQAKPPNSLRRPPRGGSLVRLRGLLRKEFYQILRDPSSLAIAFLLPLVLLLIFGYGVSLDAEHVPVALVVEVPSSDTASFTSGFQQSRYFEPVFLRNLGEAEQALLDRRVMAIVHLRSDFARRLRQPGGAPIQVIVNGVDANTARLIHGYVQGVWQKWLQRQALARGETLAVPIQLEQRVWFNSELRSRNFLVPGLIAIIMTLIGALLTAMVMAREWERGTMEALLVTPVTMREVLLGKLLPYFVLGMGGMALSVGMGVWLFGVPLRGSVWVLFGAAALFLLAALGMGLLISTVTKNQFVAGPVGHHHHLPAGVHPVGVHLRHRQHAARCPGDHSPAGRVLLRGHPANGVPGGQRLVGHPAQRPGVAADGGLLPRSQPAQAAQTFGIVA